MNMISCDFAPGRQRSILSPQNLGVIFYLDQPIAAACILGAMKPHPRKGTNTSKM